MQIVLGVALASLVCGNHLLAAAGIWISNPLTSLSLYWFNYQVGSWLMGVGPGFPSRLLLGSTLMGLITALVVSGLYWLSLRRQVPRSQP